MFSASWLISPSRFRPKEPVGLKLPPAIFVVENNGYAESTSRDYGVAVDSYVDRAAGFGLHGVTVDGLDEGSGIRVESVYCLGNCALSPAALLDGEPIGRLDRDRLDALVAGAQRKMQ